VLFHFSVSNSIDKCVDGLPLDDGYREPDKVLCAKCLTDTANSCSVTLLI
jgi:hypothetical protein